jgi:hypothetical protein
MCHFKTSFMKKFTIVLLSILLIDQLGHSQGCVVVRNISGFGQYNFTNNTFTSSNWQVDVTGRYFKSFRDFKGKEDMKTLEQNRSINHVYSTDITVSRILKDGWSINLSLPVTANSRTSTLEHGGLNTPRYSTHSFGIGDMRLTVYKWLLKTSVRQKGNVQLGLGVKLPTGDYKYQDYFHWNDSTRVLAYVNPSIQLGDGGTGIITELNTFYILNKTISVYGNFYYMMNPREQNGVPVTLGGRTPPRLDSLAANTVTSVADVYSIRAGASINFNKFSLSLGVRDEGVPVYDLLGGSQGVRRPGYNLSIEPGIVYNMKSISVYSYVPVIVSRGTKQNVPDKYKSGVTDTYIISPGGFANYLVFAGISFRL